MGSKGTKEWAQGRGQESGPRGKGCAQRRWQMEMDNALWVGRSSALGVWGINEEKASKNVCRGAMKPSRMEGGCGNRGHWGALPVHKPPCGGQPAEYQLHLVQDAARRAMAQRWGALCAQNSCSSVCHRARQRGLNTHLITRLGEQANTQAGEHASPPATRKASNGSGSLPASKQAHLLRFPGAPKQPLLLVYTQPQHHSEKQAMGQEAWQ